jgi:hypothetical protein
MKAQLFAVSILAPTVLFAQSAFYGTWKTIPDQSKSRPNQSRSP